MAVSGYDNGQYRLRGAWVNAAQLTSAYALANFPIFDDMAKDRWFDPEGSNVYNVAAQSEPTLAGGAKFVGDAWFEWVLAGLTPEMLNYLLYDASLFNGAAQMQATVETWNMEENQWEIVWTWCTRGTISDSGETGYRAGLRALTLRFKVVQDAP